MRAIFLDRDGTLVVEPYDGLITNPDNVWLQQDVPEGLKQLGQLDFTIFLLTTQPGIGQKRLTMEQYTAVNERVVSLITQHGVTVEKTYVCPHAPFEGCECKKPKPGLLRQAEADYPDIDFTSSYVIGDRLEDVGLGKAVGAQTILLDREGKYAEGTADFLASSLGEVAQIVQNPF